MDFDRLKEKVSKDFPDLPGVYVMRGVKREILYIGKAGNLKRRVSNYFIRAHDARIEKLMQEARTIEYEETDTALEALILEAKLIKEKHPIYNIREQDDKSFLYVVITKEEFPRVLLARGKDLEKDNGAGARLPAPRLRREGRRNAPFRAGPFTSAASIREALRILRRIFPWSIHTHTATSLRPELRPRGDKQHVDKKPCFDYEIGLCPGTCIGAVSKKEYRKNIMRLMGIFEGKKKRVVRALEREMEKASKALEFEKAAKLRKQIFALRHIQDVALIGDENNDLEFKIYESEFRIEGYDISNISGASAAGSMAVFINGKPVKNEYRKFKIRTITQSDDVGMFKEVLRRRFKNPWTLPNLILIDGGRGQVNAAKEALNEAGLRIPVVGMVKGPKRKKTEIVGTVPEGVTHATLVKVRDEAHRFAIRYHRKLRNIRMLG